MQKHRLDDLSDLKLSQLMDIPRKSPRKAPPQKNTRSERFGCMAWLKSSQTQPQIHGITLHRATHGHGDVKKSSWLGLSNTPRLLDAALEPNFNGSKMFEVWNAKHKTLSRSWKLLPRHVQTINLLLLNHQVRSADYILTFIRINYRELLLDYQLFLKATIAHDGHNYSKRKQVPAPHYDHIRYPLVI